MFLLKFCPIVTDYIENSTTNLIIIPRKEILLSPPWWTCV